MWGYATGKLWNIIILVHASQHVGWLALWGPTIIGKVVT
jgi:hypothetical protein